MAIDQQIMRDVASVLPDGNHPVTGKLLQISVGESKDDDGAFVHIAMTDPDLFSDNTALMKALSGTRYKISKLSGEIQPL